MTINDVIMGDVLQLFDANQKSIGGATSHTLTVSPEYAEISCKDAGLYGWKKLNKISWEIQSENLYIEEAYLGYLQNLLNDAEITVYFGASNWDENGLDTNTTYWSPTTSTSDFLYTGKAKISSLTLNAASGETASYSITLTGVGAFTPVSSGS